LLILFLKLEILWRDYGCDLAPIGAKLTPTTANLRPLAPSSKNKFAVLGANLAPMGAISKKKFFFVNKFFKFIHTCI
jgi:hypothetical protein